MHLCVRVCVVFRDCKIVPHPYHARPRTHAHRHAHTRTHSLCLSQQIIRAFIRHEVIEEGKAQGNSLRLIYAADTVYDLAFIGVLDDIKYHYSEFFDYYRVPVSYTHLTLPTKRIV